MPEWTVAQSESLRIRSQPSELADVRRRVQSASEGIGFEDKDIANIALAVDESLANVIRHSYEGPCDRPIDITIATGQFDGSDALRVVIRDFGKQIDPCNIEGRPLDDVRPGGLGVHIIRTVMDQADYECAEGGGMRLTMTKKKS